MREVRPNGAIVHLCTLPEKPAEKEYTPMGDGVLDEASKTLLRELVGEEAAVQMLAIHTSVHEVARAKMAKKAARQVYMLHINIKICYTALFC